MLPKTHFFYAWNEFDMRINQFLFDVKIHLEKAENWFYSEKPVLGSKFILEAKTDFGLGKATGPFCTNPFGGIKAMSFQND